MKLAVVTGNPHKVKEVAAYFAGILEVEHVPFESPECRHEDVGVIAEEKARYAWEALRRPLIVDDTGFYVTALNGFPGPYAAYVQDTIGNEGILKLVDGIEERSAYFETAIAFVRGGVTRIFRGRIEGVLVQPRGSEGFGYDPIFEVGGKTLAEIPLADKSQISHRARALRAFGEWLEADSMAGVRVRPDNNS